MIEIKSNAERIQRKIRAAKNKWKKESVDSVYDAAQIAKGFAKDIAPRDTGTLIKALVARQQSKTGKSHKATLEVNQGILFTHPSNVRRAEPFDYATYMHIHHGNLGRGRIVSGDARFMETTREFMQEHMKVDLQTRLRNALGRFGHGFK